MNDVILRYFVYFNLMLSVNECGLIARLLSLSLKVISGGIMFPVGERKRVRKGKIEIDAIGNREIIVKMQHVNLNVISKAIFII